MHGRRKWKETIETPSPRSGLTKEKTMLKIDPATVEVAFTQERFDAAVERARIARQNLAVARGNHKTAQQFLDDAKAEADCARGDLRDLAWSAAGYRQFEA